MIRINNKTYQGNGQNITITNGKVLINGQDVTPDSKQINIHVDGYVTHLNGEVCNDITVKGQIGNVTTQSGDVNLAGDVLGAVKTMSGDVKCNNVRGNINTMSGDIKRFKK